jgi:hypothetical protein
MALERTKAAINKVMERAVPTPSPADAAARQYGTDIYTYFTEVGGSHLIYSADGWVRIRLLLETAGPVAVSTRQSITPVLSGKGILLQTNVPYETTLAKGNRFYVAAQAINRVQWTVEPIAWGEQLTILVGTGIDRLVAAIAPKIRSKPQTLSETKTLGLGQGSRLPKRRGPRK